MHFAGRVLDGEDHQAASTAEKKKSLSRRPRQSPTTDELLADILAELKLQSGRAEAAETLDAAEKEESSASPIAKITLDNARLICYSI